MLAVVVLALLGAAIAYAPALRVPYLLDDQVAILDNESIREGPFSLRAWQPPGDGNTVQGRPVLNASFAASQALGGSGPVAHRVWNFAIHLANAGLLAALLGLLFTTPRFGPQLGSQAGILAVLVAAIWLVHPLHTLAVTYVAQRAESLASLFYLGTLTAWFAARRHPHRRTALIALAVASCGLGMLSKEIVVTAPVAVLVLDRLLYPSRIRDIPVPFRLGFVGLAATWGLLLWMLILNDFARGGSTGTAAILRSQYLVTQAYAIPLYVARILWPAGIVFDHGERIVTAPLELAAAASAWLLACALFAWLFHTRRFADAGALALFFLILSPTSSVVPVASQTIAEHRTYLASAIVLAAVVVAADRMFRPRAGALAVVLLGLAACAALASASFRMNRHLQDPLALWRDVAIRAPENWRAHASLAAALAKAGDDRAAVAALDRSLALAPGEVRSLYNRANARRRLGDWSGAESDYRQAVALDAGHAEAANNLALLLERRGDDAGARTELERVVELVPSHASAWYNLARLRLRCGDPGGARDAIERFLALREDSARGWTLAGDVHAALGNQDRARQNYERARALGTAGESF